MKVPYYNIESEHGLLCRKGRKFVWANADEPGLRLVTLPKGDAERVAKREGGTLVYDRDVECSNLDVFGDVERCKGGAR